MMWHKNGMSAISYDQWKVNKYRLFSDAGSIGNKIVPIDLQNATV